MSIVLERDEQFEDDERVPFDFDFGATVVDYRDQRQSTAWLELRLRSGLEGIDVQFNWRNEQERTTIAQVPLYRLVKSELLSDIQQANESLPEEAADALRKHFATIKDPDYDLLTMDYGQRTGFLPALNWNAILPRTSGVAFRHQPKQVFAPVMPRDGLRIAACLPSTKQKSAADAVTALEDSARACKAKLEKFRLDEPKAPPSSVEGEPTRPPTPTPEHQYPGVRHPHLTAILNRLRQHGADVVWIIGEFAISLNSGAVVLPGDGHGSHVGADELACFARALGAWAIVLRSVNEDTSGARLLAWQLDRQFRTPLFVFGSRDQPMSSNPLKYLNREQVPADFESRAADFANPYGYQPLVGWHQRHADEQRLLDDHTLTRLYRKELESPKARRVLRSLQRFLELELAKTLEMPEKLRERHQAIMRERLDDLNRWLVFH